MNRTLDTWDVRIELELRFALDNVDMAPKFSEHAVNTDPQQLGYELY